MALYEEESEWKRNARKAAEQEQRKKLIAEYGENLGKALADSTLDVRSPVDEELAVAIVQMLASGSPGNQELAIMAILAYAKEAGRAAAEKQSRHDNATY
jgi:hypothetical protein